MAITGTLTANFASFFEACEKAQVSLRGFEASTGKVESSLSRMVDNFSGRKIISEATLMAQAVETIGGTSKLTEAELTRMGNVAAEAANKLQAWGQDVPKGIQDLATHAKTATSTFDSMKSVVADLAAGFAAMFTARAAFNFVKNTVDEASALVDLSNQTHINVEELQLLAGSMSQFGVDADTLGRGLYKLSRGIATGDDSVAGGLHQMGLSLKDVEGLNGQELFLKIEHGLSTLQGGLRDTTAAELFGGKLGAAMAGASEGIDGALETWRRFNNVASKESVEALDNFGESIERAIKSLKAMATNGMGPVAQGFNTLNDAVIAGASKWDLFVAGVKDFSNTMVLGTTQTGAMTQVLDDLNQKTLANTKATTDQTVAHQAIKVALDAHAQAAQFMAALELDSAKPVLDWQAQYLAHLKEIGELTAKNAAGIGVSASQLAKYNADRAAAEAEFKKVEEEQLAIAKTLDEFRHAAHMRQVEIIRIQTDEQLKAAGVVNAAIQAEFEAQTTLNASWGRDAAGAIQLQRGALETLNAAMEALHQKKVEGISQAKEEQVLINNYTKQLYDEAVARDKVSAAATNQVAAINGVTAAYWAQIDASARAAGVTVVGNRPGEAPGINGAPPSGFSLGGFSLGTPFSLTQLPPVVSSHKDGGPVSAGLAMLHDDEYVVPKGGALVSGGGGSTNVTIYVTQPLGTPDAIAVAVRQALVDQAKNSGRRL